MPQISQIIPQGSIKRPKIETHINDNTIVDLSSLAGGGKVNSLMCVMTSPKGRDNQVITIQNEKDFKNEFGLGSFANYGQPHMNAYTACRAASFSQAMVHCMRVMPEDATYSNVTVLAQYYTGMTEAVGEEGDEEYEPSVPQLFIRYVSSPGSGAMYSLDDLDIQCVPVDKAYTATNLDDSEFPSQPMSGDKPWKTVRLFSVATLGRGDYGTSFSIRLTSDSASDKYYDFKCTTFAIYRQEVVFERVESYVVNFNSDCITSTGESFFIDDVLADPDNGSSYLKVISYEESYMELYDAYCEVMGENAFPYEVFDPLLGVNKYTKLALEGITILGSDFDTGIDKLFPVNLSDTAGIPLCGGFNGSLDLDNLPEERQEVLDYLYEQAFYAELDPYIKSKNRFPTSIIMDANFPVATKLAMVALTVQRNDCMVMLDYGLDIRTKASIGTYYDTHFNGFIDNWRITMEAYCFTARDPYNSKTMNVTCTYWLCSQMLIHWNAWNGKHRPLAGNRFGVMSGYIKNTVYPVFDEELDADMMDDYADVSINLAAYNQNQVIVRKMQNTAQSVFSNLTEQSNCLVLMDVKRSCEQVCAQLEYDFSEAEDIARYNAALSVVTDKYAGNQVRSISVKFDKNTWEAERNILHLYVEMVHKDLIKTIIIEIDVNR